MEPTDLECKLTAPSSAPTWWLSPAYDQDQEAKTATLNPVSGRGVVS